MGPASGAKPDSFRAKAYGMLATLCFLTRLAEFTGSIEPWVGILATDSQSLLDTVLEKSQPPNDEEEGNSEGSSAVKLVTDLRVDGPEWDIVSNTLVLLASQPGLTLQYVKGHQDRDNAYEHLPLLAQLNVDADAMATRYQRSHGRQRPIALLTDTAKVHLVTPNGSVTSRYGTALRLQATYDPLMSYIGEKYEWCPRVQRSINWEAHGGSLKKRSQHQVHFIKLVHEILPTGKRQFRTDYIRSLCPACKSASEDWQHILLCKELSRDTWRSDMVKTLEKKCKELNTRPLLQRVLLAGITGWLHSGDQFRLEATNYSPEVHRLIRSQNEVGWRQLFLGRFCLDWSTLQDDFYSRSRGTNHMTASTGQRWQVSIIGELWDQWRCLWNIRNQELHGATISQQMQAEFQDVLRDLRDIYDKKPLMEPSIQELLYPEVTDHLEKSTWFNKNWIAIHGPLAKASIKRAQERAIQGVRSIRQYFSTR